MLQSLSPVFYYYGIYRLKARNFEKPGKDPHGVSQSKIVGLLRHQEEEQKNMNPQNVGIDPQNVGIDPQMWT